MKKLLLTLLLFGLCARAADKKISELPPVTALGATDTIEVVQAGANSKITVANAFTLAAGVTFDSSAATVLLPPFSVPFLLPSSAAPTVDALGEIAADSDFFAASKGALLWYDGTGVRVVPAYTNAVPPTDGQVLSWDDTNKWWEPATAGAGSGDVTAASSFGTDNILIRSDGTGKGVQASAISLSDTGAFTFADGVKQVFNPDGTNPGLNVGSHTADPSAPADGDVWYATDKNSLRARVNGYTLSLGAPERNAFIERYEDFLQGAAQFFASAGNVFYNIDAFDAGHPGTLTAQANNASSSVTTHVGGMFFGGGRVVFETVLRISRLSVSGDFVLRVGFGDVTTAGAFTDGVWFSYTDNVNSGNFVANCKAGATSGSTNMAVGPALDTWVRLTIEVSADGDTATFYVNGANSVTVTTANSIPDSTGELVGMVINPSSTSANLTQTYVDYAWFRQWLTTPR